MLDWQEGIVALEKGFPRLIEAVRRVEATSLRLHSRCTAYACGTHLALSTEDRTCSFFFYLAPVSRAHG